MTPVPRVPVLTRSDWGGPPTGAEKRPLQRATQIVVHHTAQGFGYAARPGVTGAEGERAVRSVRAAHVDRDVGDVGYPFLVDGAGRVYQGRAYLAAGSFGPGRTPPALALGSHVGGKNTGRIGVSVLGCFGGGPGERGCEDVPSAAAVEALTRLLAALCVAYDVAPSTIVGHRDLAATACPGRHLYARLGQVRGAVAAAVSKAR
ncbi:MAG TPA: peptidoglycan recognition family protein [Rubricoccaceae bacterium]